jgi:hypothetical protein
MAEHDLAELMSTAATMVWSFNHQSRPEPLSHAGVSRYLATSEVRRITGSMAELAQQMPQALTYLADALQRWPDLPNGDARDLHPVHRCAIAAGALSEAAEAFAVAADHLCDARAAVATDNVGGDAQSRGI